MGLVVNETTFKIILQDFLFLMTRYNDLKIHTEFSQVT